MWNIELQEFVFGPPGSDFVLIQSFLVMPLILPFGMAMFAMCHCIFFSCRSLQLGEFPESQERLPGQF